jgi:hypothetical protein
MKRKMVREELDGQVYEYTPLGKYIVSAPAVCRGTTHIQIYAY